MSTKICIIGGGNLGLSITNGLLSNKNFDSKLLNISKRNTESIKHLKSLGVSVFSDNVKAINEVDLILIAVKPYDVAIVLNQIKNHIKPNQIIVSVASGITIKEILKHLEGNNVNPIYRAMPNTAAEIGESITCIASSDMLKINSEKVKSFFDLIGKTIYIKEELMDAATVLGACGIAFVLRFIRWLKVEYKLGLMLKQLLKL